MKCRDRGGLAAEVRVTSGRAGRSKGTPATIVRHCIPKSGRLGSKECRTVIAEGSEPERKPGVPKYPARDRAMAEVVKVTETGLSEDFRGA